MLAIIAAGAAKASQQGASQRDVANVMDATDKLGQGFTTLRYSKDKGREADQIGIFLLADAGMNPAAFPSFWARKAAINGSGGPDFLGTHPIDSDRYTMAIHLLPLAQERAARITRQTEYPLKAPNQEENLPRSIGLII